VNTKKKGKGSAAGTDDLEPEYTFDYSKARPNPFAGHIGDDRILVLLDADVSKVFTSPEAVNTVLRALMTAMPNAAKKKRSRNGR
jgi:hypothetical protein